MARTDPQVNFRIPAELKDKLDQAAKENNRTITAELVLRLESTFENVSFNNETQDNSTIEQLEKLAPLMQAVFESIKEIPNVRGDQRVVEKLDTTIEAIENIYRKNSNQ